MKSTVPWKIFQSGNQFPLGPLTINTFRIPHDAAEPVGFVLTGNNTRLSMVSDVGHVTHLMREHLRGSDAIYVEANYDPALLEQDTKRPWSTKQRIASRHGHLSNSQTAELLAEVACQRLKVVMLSHLSSDCNCPEIARTTVRTTLAQNGLGHIHIHCAHQHYPTGWIHIPAPHPQTASP